MGFQIVDLVNVAVATATATSSAVGFPATRMASLDGPFIRGWRSTSTGTQTLTFTFAGSTSIVGCLIYDVNFVSVTAGGSGRTVAADKYDSLYRDRYKIWVPFTTTASSQTVTIPSQTPVDGNTYFKCGRVHFFTAYTELAQNPKPEMPIIAIDPQFVAGEEDGPVYESMNAGATFIKEEWSWLGETSLAEDLYTVARIGSQSPFILYHNLGSDAEAYYMQRVGGVSVHRGNVTEDLSMSFRQIP